MAEKRVVLEWSVENFSCWNADVHGDVFFCPDSANDVRLYPRGGSDNLSLRVELKGTIPRDSDCLFIWPPAQKILYRLATVPRDTTYDVVVVKGPKYEEIINQIRQNGTLHKDQLTIRLESQNFSNNVFHVRTVLDAFDTSLKINSEIFKDSDAKIDTWNFISTIECPDQNLVQLKVFYRKKRYKLGKECVNLKLCPGKIQKKALVRICISTMSYGKVFKLEEGERVFEEGKGEWINSEPVPKNYGSGNGFVLIDLKIIPGSLHKFKHSTSHGNQVSIEWENLSVSDKPVASNQHENPEYAFKKDFMCLYQDQDFSDLQLKCDSVSFPVHRNILSARSPVFKTMLSTDMTEAASGSVDIGDLDPSTLGLFLTYLYTGEVEEDLQSDRALKLYYAADKYQVPSLKRECANFLSANVSVSNVCDVLTLGDKHQDDQMKSVADDFILENFNDVLKSKEWEDLMKHEPLLAVKTITRFAQCDHVGKIF